MGDVSETVRALWLKAQLEAPPFVQRSAIPRLHEAKEIARFVVKPWLPVCELRGQGYGGPLTVTYVGLDFTKPFLKDILFSQEPVENRLEPIPIWRHSTIADRFSSDVVIVEGGKHLIQRLPMQSAIVFPPLVDHVLDVSGDWQDVKGRFRQSVRRNELKWMRRYGYEYDISHDQHDLERFYHEMYMPTMQGRHGELATPESLPMSRQYFAHGGLFRVKREGVWVSGVVCYPMQDILIAKIAGVKGADEQLIHEGATAAVYYAAIHWANQQGYQAVNFLGSGARLNSGLFQHKRKWGAAVSISPHLHRLIWLRVQRVTPGVSRFLKENPFVVLDDVGKLYGLVFVDDPAAVSLKTKKEWLSRYETPGLSSLIVRSVDSLTDPNNATPGSVLSIASGSGSETI